jgi:hypothetical protein
MSEPGEGFEGIGGFSSPTFFAKVYIIIGLEHPPPFVLQFGILEKRLQSKFW